MSSTLLLGDSRELLAAMEPGSVSAIVIRDCPGCGCAYAADPKRLKHGRQTTCSRKCSYDVRAAKKRTAQRVEGVRVASPICEIKCSMCGERFTRRENKRKSKHGAEYCSRKCHYAGRSAGLTKRVVSDPYTITESGRAGWKAMGDRRRGTPYKEPVSWDCEVCGKTRTLNRGQLAPARKFRFCSHACANVSNRGESNPSWKGGHRGYYGPDWRPQRRLARERDGHACQGCGATRDELGRELDVHHIIRFGDFENSGEANRIENLISLCHSCHMHAENHGTPAEWRCRRG